MQIIDFLFSLSIKISFHVMIIFSLLQNCWIHRWEKKYWLLGSSSHNLFQNQIEKWVFFAWTPVWFNFYRIDNIRYDKFYANFISIWMVFILLLCYPDFSCQDSSYMQKDNIDNEMIHLNVDWIVHWNT